MSDEIKDAEYYFNNSIDETDHLDGDVYVDTKTANDAIEVFTEGNND